RKVNLRESAITLSIEPYPLPAIPPPGPCRRKSHSSKSEAVQNHSLARKKLLVACAVLALPFSRQGRKRPTIIVQPALLPPLTAARALAADADPFNRIPRGER